MKYLVAYKPCGCIYACHDLLYEPDAESQFRDMYAREGLAVRVTDDDVPIDASACAHGSLAFQLAAKLAAAEARRDELAKWLREQIGHAACAADRTFSSGNLTGTLRLDVVVKALREVLAHVEGTEGQR